MRRIGVVVNPIAGMGGRVGLKGTDGKVEAARERGAEPRAPERGATALAALREYGDGIEVLTWGEPMGAGAARDAGFDPVVLGEPASEETTSEETRAAVRAFREQGVDLVFFVGGDGTAVDVAEELGEETPMLGVPAGVKVYSSVFGVSPRAAGRIAARFTDTERAEVNDIDEDEYRRGEVVTELRAVVRVPQADERQSAKQLGGGTVETLAEAVAEEARPGVTYVLGPGSTVGAIKSALGFDGTTLGVDVWRDGAVLVRDGGEAEIVDALGEDNVVIVSPIGGQGFVFGRGNQQLSPAVIERCEIEVVASRAKLDDIGVLRVDTGDPALDEQLRGWLRVRVGAFERRLVEVA
ncbi:ATP-NAD kinase family protein [Halomicrobium sp. IBSBa]|uniref:ATP-NAD kinase family protein n=1 Tax=Halomicrobium sp. IBSBa TaxID=2778916 RepID=UPI001ABFDFF1|nr:ATP-NAD kinase family protein [Halomicrobium sp. IBSBa]MBO4248336.1 ATP-NAD kinase family protein [Halomicrobium sp. IBSBa]